MGVSLAKQAEFAAISEQIAWNNPRVVSFDQYLLRDDPPVKSSNPILRWPGSSPGSTPTRVSRSRSTEGSGCRSS